MLNSRPTGWVAASSRTAATICSGGHRRQARVPGEPTGGPPGVPARRVLVAEQLDRYAERSPAQRRHHRREQRDHRSAHRRGEVRRPGVGDHRDLARSSTAASCGEIEPPAEIKDAGDSRARAATMRLVSGCSAALPVSATCQPSCDEPVHRGGPERSTGRPAPVRWPRGAPRRAALEARTAAPHRRRAVGGVPGADRRHRPAARIRPRVRTAACGPVPALAGHRQPDVEQRTGIVLADRGDPPPRPAAAATRWAAATDGTR